MSFSTLFLYIHWVRRDLFKSLNLARASNWRSRNDICNILIHIRWFLVSTPMALAKIFSVQTVCGGIFKYVQPSSTCAWRIVKFRAKNFADRLLGMLIRVIGVVLSVEQMWYGVIISLQNAIRWYRNTYILNAISQITFEYKRLFQNFGTNVGKIILWREFYRITKTSS